MPLQFQSEAIGSDANSIAGSAARAKLIHDAAESLNSGIRHQFKNSNKYMMSELSKQSSNLNMQDGLNQEEVKQMAKGIEFERH